jgi:adenylosuccinate synthase
MNGIPPQMIRRIYGVAKAYRTYVGSKEFETPSAVFERIRELGHEYGATTGRPRQIDWLDLDKLIVAANVNGVTDLVINKADILQDVQTFCLYYEGEQRIFPSFETFQEFVEEKMRFSCVYLRDITWSFSPYSI